MPRQRRTRRRPDGVAARKRPSQRVFEQPDSAADLPPLVTSQAVDGLFAMFKRRSVGILVAPLRRASDGYFGGTGTLVRVGSHALLATASHVVIGRRAEAITLMHQSTALPREGLVRAIHCHSVDEDDPIDVAVLELDPATLSFSEWGFVDLDDVELTGPYVAGDLLAVHGYPSQFRRPNARTKVLMVDPFMYLAPVVKSKEWPRINPPANPRIELMMRYLHHQPVPGHRHRQSPDLRGVSGGGIWAVKNTRALWAPSMAKLVAIQRSWIDKRLIVGVQVRHWLELVARVLPDVAPQILRKLGQGRAGVTRLGKRRSTRKH